MDQKMEDIRSLVADIRAACSGSSQVPERVLRALSTLELYLRGDFEALWRASRREENTIVEVNTERPTVTIDTTRASSLQLPRSILKRNISFQEPEGAGHESPPVRTFRIGPPPRFGPSPNGTPLGTTTVTVTLPATGTAPSHLGCPLDSPA